MFSPGRCLSHPVTGTHSMWLPAGMTVRPAVAETATVAPAPDTGMVVRVAPVPDGRRTARAVVVAEAPRQCCKAALALLSRAVAVGPEAQHTAVETPAEMLARPAGKQARAVPQTVVTQVTRVKRRPGRGNRVMGQEPRPVRVAVAAAVAVSAVVAGLTRRPMVAAVAAVARACVTSAA